MVTQKLCCGHCAGQGTVQRWRLPFRLIELERRESVKTYIAIAGVVLGLVWSKGLPAQDTPPKIAEPEFNMVFFSLDSVTGALTALERKQANTQAKVRALGYGGVNGLTVFKGESSSIRFKEGQKVEFVFRMDSPGIDPSMLVTLEVLKASKGNRELKTMQARMFWGKTGSTVGESSKGLNFAKYGEHSYRCSPAEALPKGEYALMSKSGAEGFLFGID